MNPELKRLRAEEVMNPTVRWADPHENLRTAADRMVEHRVRALLVGGEMPADMPGIVTSKDIVNLIGAHDLAVLDRLHVEDATTRPAVCVPRTSNLLDCINLMRMSSVRRVPVLDGVRVVGILSLSDVFVRLLRR